MSTETIRKILHVEDSRFYRDAIAEAAEEMEADHGIKVISAGTKAAALAIIEEQGHDLYAVITDNDLPDDKDSAVEIATAALKKGIKKVVIASFDFDKKLAPNGTIVWHKSSANADKDLMSIL